jgi:hypothetical protein
MRVYNLEEEKMGEGLMKVMTAGMLGKRADRIPLE